MSRSIKKGPFCAPELLKKNGLFRHMAQLQSESMEWTA